MAMEICLAVSPVLALQPPAVSESSEVALLIDFGRYGEAVAVAQRRLTEAQDVSGTEASRLVAILGDLVDALGLSGSGAEAHTRALAERAVERAQRATPRDELQLARALSGLASVHVWQGDYSRGVGMYNQALRIQQRVAPVPARAMARTLDGLGYALLRAGRHPEAASVLVRALELGSRGQASADGDVGTTLEHLAATELQLGQREQARGHAERALAIREGQAHQAQLAGALNLLGDVCWFESQFSKAEGWYARAVTVGQTHLGPTHPDVAVYSLNLANARRVVYGDSEQIRALMEWALKVTRARLGPTHPDLALMLNDLAIASRGQGDYRDARQYYEDALKVIDARLGPEHLWGVTVRHNLAVLCQRLGDLDEAIRLEKRAMAIWERTSGAAHADVGRAASALAGMYADAGWYDLARVTYARAVAIRKRHLGPNHQDVATSLSALAAVLMHLHRPEEASAHLAEALAIWTRNGVSVDPSFLNAVATRGRLEAERGDFIAARATLRQVLETQERVLGATNPDVARLRVTFGEVLVDLDDAADALSHATQAEAAGRTHLQLTMRDLSERVALGYAAARPKGLDLAASIVARTPARPADAARVFDEVIQSRGMVLEEMAARNRMAAASIAPGLVEPTRRLASVRQRLANLTVRGPEGLSADRYAAAIEEARIRKEQAERELAGLSAEFGKERARSQIRLGDLLAFLRPDEAMVSFLRFDDYRPPRVAAAGRVTRAARQAVASSRRVPSYLAFILRGGSPEVRVVRIGDARETDAAVARWRDEVRTGLSRQDRSLASAERAANAAGVALRRQIWDPLVESLDDAQRVFIVPDGALNLVSFGALPVDALPVDGRLSTFLVERGPVLHYLSAERDLVAPAGSPRPGTGLLALGAPAFDTRGRADVRETSPAEDVTHVTPGASSRPAARTRAASTNCVTLQTMQFDGLPGSLREIQEVARIWDGAAAPVPAATALAESVELLSRAAASERAFKTRAPGRRVLHLATHGFFLGGACTPGLEGTRAVGGVSSAGAARPGAALAKIDNPLMLSGLAFAGANRRARSRVDEDDGILTAEEVAGLNLEGVEWAVLSACDTGIGAIKAGEGVFGLRRAFQIAGVRTVILSLWAVEDRSAVHWMRALYEHRRRGGLDTAEAVRAASLDVLRQRRARGESVHPFFWAGFVATGDWR